MFSVRNKMRINPLIMVASPHDYIHCSKPSKYRVHQVDTLHTLSNWPQGLYLAITCQTLGRYWALWSAKQCNNLHKGRYTICPVSHWQPKSWYLRRSKCKWRWREFQACRGSLILIFSHLAETLHASQSPKDHAWVNSARWVCPICTTSSRYWRISP